MVDARRTFGDDAEALAARFCEAQGMRILARQWSSKFGELDLVAKDGGEVVAVEVKARRSNAFGYPEEAVTPAKLRKIRLTLELYVREHAPRSPFRVDVMAIEYDVTPPKITHIRNVG